MKQKNFLKIVLFTLLTFSAMLNIKAQTLTAGDIAIIGVGVDDEEILLVALADIPSGESIFFTDDEWAGSAFITGEGFYEWQTASTISAGTVITLTTSAASVGGTVTQRAGSFALGNSGDGVFLYQTSTNTYNTGTYTILAFAGEDSGDAGTLSGTGLTEGTNAVYFGGDNGIFSGVRTTNDKSGHLTNIYNSANWTTSGTAQTFDTTNFAMTGAGPGITLGAVSGNTSEDGTQATFTVVLNTQPATDVVLNVTSGDTGEVTLDVANLTFTNANWDTPQTVTAAGVDDGVQDGSIDVTITISVDDGLSDDAYDAVDDVTTTVTNEDNEITDLVVNEVLADPDETTGDANGDGTVSTQDDEFVELYNTTGSALDISGYKLSDGASERHVFPNGTVIPAGGTIVVFGGGIVSDFTDVGGLVQVASTSALGLNNGGDTITILDASDVLVVNETYGAAGNDQSIARSPDFTGSFVDHSIIGTNTVDFSPGKDNTDNSPFIKTWTGATDSVWATATNWLEGDTPGASDNAIVRAGATNYPTASAAAVTINSLIIESGATLITTNTFNAEITYKKSITNASQWYLMSSPIVGETYNDAWVTANSISSGSTSATNRGVSTYDNTTNDGTTGHWRYLQGGGSGTFNSGQGYGIILSNSGDVSFVGSGVYTASQTFGITQGASNNYNLIANPFTAYLNLGDFFTDNGSGVITGGATWFWNGSAYETKTAGVDGIYEINPGEGFFVEAAANTDLTFDIADVSHQAVISFGKTANTRPEILLTIKEDVNERTARVVYIDGTTKGYDVGYDGKLFGGITHSLAVYSELLESDGKKHQLQSLPNSDYENMVIPVGVIAEAGKEITFTADALNIPNGLHVYLEDRLTGDVTRLDEANSEYKITLSESLDGVGRFYLHTKSSAVLSTEDLAVQGAQIFASTNRTLKVTGVNSTKATLKLYNLLGKQVMQTSFSSTGKSTLNLPNLSTGVYIVQLSTDKGQLNKKIVLE